MRLVPRRLVACLVMLLLGFSQGGHAALALSVGRLRQRGADVIGAAAYFGKLS